MASITDTAIPLGSDILITGVNGFVASHVADQLLLRGYKVRGSVRDVQKSNWIKDVFNDKYGAGKFELVQVGDITTKGAFTAAMRGVAGVVHVATILGGADPDTLLSSIVKINEGLLETAAQESSVKRFVYTSSSEAAAYTSLDEQGTKRVTVESWNEEAVEEARAPPRHDMKRGFHVYCASKTVGEQSVWKWVEKNRPQFMTNTVLPSLCFGASIDPEHQGHASSSGWPAAFFKNEIEPIMPFINGIVPTGAYCVDVQDVGRLHVAGLLHSKVKNERIFAFGVPFTWNGIIEAFRSMFPDSKFPDDVTRQEIKGSYLEVEPASRAQELLREMGRNGWATLEEILNNNVADLV